MDEYLSDGDLFRSISDAPGIRDAARELNSSEYWDTFNKLYSPDGTDIRPAPQEDPEVTDRGYWDFWERQIEYNDCEVCVWHYPRVGRLKLSPWVVCRRLPGCRPRKCFSAEEIESRTTALLNQIESETPVRKTNIPPPCPSDAPGPMGEPDRINAIRVYLRVIDGSIYTGNYPNPSANNHKNDNRYFEDDFSWDGVYDPLANDYTTPRTIEREKTFFPSNGSSRIEGGAFNGCKWGYNKYVEQQLKGGRIISTELTIFSYHPNYRALPDGTPIFSIIYGYSISFFEYEVNGVLIRGTPPERDPPEPPTPPKPPMRCCPQQTQDLSQIKRMLHQLMKWTGAAPGAMLVPASLMDQSPGGGWLENLIDFITPEQKILIRSLPEYLTWHLEREQEYWGQWPTGAKDEKGNEVYYPNLAVYLSNLQSQLFAQKKIDSQQTIALCKLLLENALARQDIVQTKSLCFAIVDFLGFNLLEKREKIKHSFKIPEDKEVSSDEVDEVKEVDDFLENTEVDMRVFDFDPRHIPEGSKKPVETFMDTARRVLKVLELLQAVHCIPVDKDNPEPDLKKFIKDYLKFNKPPSEDDDLEAWAERVEVAFSTDENPPPSVGNNPYGNSYTERPRIKFYGKRASDTGDQA